MPAVYHRGLAGCGRPVSQTARFAGTPQWQTAPVAERKLLPSPSPSPVSGEGNKCRRRAVATNSALLIPAK
jgi:hypothetical protein